MSPEEHKAHHVILDQNLHELFADFIKHNARPTDERSNFGFTARTIGELISWSYTQTKNPTEEKQ